MPLRMFTTLHPPVKLLLFGLLLFAVALGSGCDTPPMSGAPPMPDLGPRCAYDPAPLPSEPVGQVIPAGSVQAGVGEAPLDLPVGTPLGGYSDRMKLLGGHAPDSRQSPHARAFAPSTGVQTRPLVRALYLQVGSEPLLIVKADVCLSYDRLVFDLEQTLAQDGLMPARGHVFVATSHTHSGPGTYHGAFHLTLGLDLFEESQYRRLLASLVTAARAAISGAAPARIGAGIWDGWDKNDDIYQDRRQEDDVLPGPDGMPIGPHKEQRLLVLRVDDAAGHPLALVDSFPIHGTVAGGDNSLISVEAPGHVELALEDRFSSKILAMHLQGPAGDSSPNGRQGLSQCDSNQALCADFSRMESIGELAAPRIMNLYSAITTTDQATLEVVTRTFHNGRDVQIRGDMTYSPFVPGQDVDSSAAGIYTPDGGVKNPITQFNVEAGAGLCGSKSPSLPVDGIPGATGVPYGSCADIGAAENFISEVLSVPSPPEGVPTCDTTRTTVSAVRLAGIPVQQLDGSGNPLGGSDPSTLLLVTLPGEPLSMLADELRSRVGAPAEPELTFVLGYTQDHIGYILQVEDWLLGGYEPSINLFGPLEGEWLMERGLDVAKLAMTPERDDPEAPGPGNPAPGARFDRPVFNEGNPLPVPRSPSDLTGQLPMTTPPDVLTRLKSMPPPGPQPDANITRVIGRATFLFYGGDPEDDLPEVTLEQETSPNSFAPVLLPSGRAVGSRGRDILLIYTPEPIEANPGQATAHVWAAEWQAVGWDRSQGLAQALSVPLGRYRLAVHGRTQSTTYDLNSNPFTVVAAGAVAVSATRNANQISGTAVYPVGNGFRLLRLDGPSDGNVPVTGMTTIQVMSKKDGAMTTAQQSLAAGSFTADISGLDTTAGLTILVEDAAGNSGQIDIP